MYEYVDEVDVKETCEQCGAELCVECGGCSVCGTCDCDD